VYYNSCRFPPPRAKPITSEASREHSTVQYSHDVMQAVEEEEEEEELALPPERDFDLGTR
jgi:hypothetical protein